MLSSMTPTIVSKEGEVVLVTGSPGGSTIITTVLQVVSNVIDHGMGLSDAVAHPSFHHQWLPDSILVEKKGFSSLNKRYIIMVDTLREASCIKKYDRPLGTGRTFRAIK